MTATPAAHPGLIQQAGRAAAVCADNAAQADRDGRLSTEVTAAIRDAGFPRHFVPARWGGTAGSFTDFLAATTLIAAADPSAGWCAAVTAAAGRMAGFLPKTGQQALWGDGPDAFIAAALQPAGTAQPASGGWQASGRWEFVTGAGWADWVLLSCRASPAHTCGDTVTLLVPSGACRIEETWQGTGLRATRNDTVILPAAFVPAGHSFPRADLLRGRPGRSWGCHCLPHDAVSGLFFAAALLGAAQAALDTWVRAARRRAPVPPGNAAGRDAVLARCAGEIDAAQLLLERAAASADHPPMTPLEAARARRDYWLIGSLLAGAVSELFRAGGTRATTDGTFARLWRDVNAASVHPALQPQPAAADYAGLVLGAAGR